VSTVADEISLKIRNVPDFPKPGIQFKDISPLLLDYRLTSAAAYEMARPFINSGVTHVVAPESRGFIFGPAIATILGCGFVMARKPGNLPGETVTLEYEKEYGADRLEILQGILNEYAKVLVHDDVLATGGTARAIGQLCGLTGAMVVGSSFLIELDGLNGRESMALFDPTHAVLKLTG
jgi:adenine phosphoribosyltransferase